MSLTYELCISSLVSLQPTLAVCLSRSNFYPPDLPYVTLLLRKHCSSIGWSQSDTFSKVERTICSLMYFVSQYPTKQLFFFPKRLRSFPALHFTGDKRCGWPNSGQLRAHLQKISVRLLGVRNYKISANSTTYWQPPELSPLKRSKNEMKASVKQHNSKKTQCYLLENDMTKLKSRQQITEKF